MLKKPEKRVFQSKVHKERIKFEKLSIAFSAKLEYFRDG
jgi:hypothetical protein